MIRTRQLLLLVGLAVLSQGCILGDVLDFTQAFPTVLLYLLVLFFAIFVGPVSLVGIGFAVRHLVQRRPRSFRHVAISAPFAVVAVGLHALVTHGFTGVHPQDLLRVWRWWPGAVHPELGSLLVFSGTPLLWLAVAVIDAALAPSAVEERISPDKAVLAVAPTLIVLSAYVAIVSFSLPGSPLAPETIHAPVRPITSAEAGITSAAPPAPPAARGPFELLWTTETGERNDQIAFTASGEILAVGSSQLHMIDAATGKIAMTVPSCSSARAGGFGWLDEGHAALVCNGEIRGYEMPALASTTLVTRQARDVVAGAVHPKLLIASDSDDRKALVRLFDPRTHEKLAELRLPVEKVEGVAIAPDGALFALGFERNIEFREAPTGRVVGKMPVVNSPVGLSFSPDGKLLLANTPAFAASVIDVAAKRMIRLYNVGSSLTQSRWRSDGSIVTTGSDGLLAFFPDGTRASARAPEERWTGQGLAVSADGTRVCAGDSDGRIRMFRLDRAAPPSP